MSTANTSTVPVAWVDTILGAAPTDERTGDLARNTSSDLGNAAIAIAKGCLAPGDGGGGVFFWSVGTDDGGTFIVPNSTVGAQGKGWQRIYGGALNVKWFGAIPGSGPADGGIQAAINAAMNLVALGTSSCAAEVYVPHGEYSLWRPLVIPRFEFAFARGFTFRGDGPGVTSLRAVAPATDPERGLASNTPVLSFDGAYSDVYFFSLAGMTLCRDNPGAVFAYTPTLPPQVTSTPQPSRMLQSVFRDLFLNAAGANTQASALHLVHCHDSSFENIVLQGGESALRMSDCSRCVFAKLNINLADGIENGGSASGIVVEGGGSHTFRNTRIEAPGLADTPKGYGIYIASNHLIFDHLDFEDKGGMAYQIYIASGQQLTFLDASIAGVAHSGFAARGLYIGPDAHNVRFMGGVFSELQGSNASVFVEAGASDIVFDNVKFSGKITPESVVFKPGVQRIRANFVGVGPDGWDASCLNRGMIGSMTAAPVVSARGYDVWRLSSSSAVAITTIDGGYDGQVLTLLGAEGVSLETGGNLKLSSPFNSGSPGAAIRLIYELASSSWLELGRS